MYLHSLGISESAGPKLPKISLISVEEHIEKAGIGKDAKVVWMSDGAEDPASALASACRSHPHIVQHEKVNHSAKMWGRSCMVKDERLPDGSYKWKPCVAGDQKCEQLFKQLNGYVPKGLKFDDSIHLELWLRYGQWRLQAGNEDIWPRFCRAMREYPQRLLSEAGAAGMDTLSMDVAEFLKNHNGIIKKMCIGEGLKRKHAVAANVVSKVYNASAELSHQLGSKVEQS